MKVWEWNIVFKIQVNDQKIIDKIFERFPVWDSEAKCKTERETRKQAREAYARKLLKNENVV